MARVVRLALGGDVAQAESVAEGWLPESNSRFLPLQWSGIEENHS